MLMAALTLGACVPKEDYDKLQKENNKLEREVQEYRERQQKEVASFKELMADLKPLIDRGILDVEVVEGRVTIGMAADVLFPSGSADLSNAGKANLVELTRILSRRVGDRDFQVEGHTDNQPISTAQYADNWALGSARSLAVLRFMVDNGFPKDNISAATFGDTEPVAPNSDDSGRAKNRRIEVVLLPDVGDLPGYKALTSERPGRQRGNRKHKNQ
jgi:chemotaxis protein MotB